MSGPTIQDRRPTAAPGFSRPALPRLRTVASERRIGLSFSGEPIQAERARHRVEALLAFQWGRGPAADDAGLVAGEVLANGCRYGGGRVRVRARISSRSITLTVSTPAPWRVQEVEPSGVVKESGWGLEIVEALAESVCIGTDPDGRGVSVTVVCLAGPARTAAAEPGGA